MKLHMQCSIDMPISARMSSTDGDVRAVPYSAEELERLLADGALERIGIGTRRACYRLPDGRRCLKCYRSDAEIEEGKYPGFTPVRPLASAAVREIRRCRFDERRNTCCQEYRYWLELRKRLPDDLMAAFPSTVEQLRLPSRGWALVEELVVSVDGSPPRKFAEEWLDAAADRRHRMFSEFNALAENLVRNAVRFYDPQTIFVQNLEGGSFRLRITDFEPASRLLIPVDAIPFMSGFKVRRRFAKFLAQNGVQMPSDNMYASKTAVDTKVNVLCFTYTHYFFVDFINDVLM